MFDIFYTYNVMTYWVSFYGKKSVQKPEPTHDHFVLLKMAAFRFNYTTNRNLPR